MESCLVHAGTTEVVEPAFCIGLPEWCYCSICVGVSDESYHCWRCPPQKLLRVTSKIRVDFRRDLSMRRCRKWLITPHGLLVFSKVGCLKETTWDVGVFKSWLSERNRKCADEQCADPSAVIAFVAWVVWRSLFLHRRRCYNTTTLVVLYKTLAQLPRLYLHVARLLGLNWTGSFIAIVNSHVSTSSS